jgi:hypothetical protein
MKGRRSTMIPARRGATLMTRRETLRIATGALGCLASPGWVAASLRSATAASRETSSASPALQDPARHRQLFLSDTCIEKMSGLKRTLHQPRKLGPVLRPDRSQGQTSLQSSSPPQWNSEKSIWEWWYRGANAFYATSTDGVNWVRPLLKLYELNGSKDNNIAYTPGQRSLAHVIRDEKEADPKRRYKALFSEAGRDRWPAVSPDGFHWTFQEGPPIPSRDTSMFTYDEISEQYLALVKLPTEWGRSVWLATSKDFVRFTDPKLILHADEIDRENCAQRVREVMNNPAYIKPPIFDDQDYAAEIYLMPVLPYAGAYIGFPNLYNPIGAIPPPQMNFTRINQVELAVSPDLYRWERVADRAVFLGIEPWDGIRYDTNQVLLCGRPIVREDKGEIWFYYNALRTPTSRELYQTHNRNKELFRLNVDPELFSDTGAPSLATLRLDGFVSLDAEEVGWVITKPFMLKGGGSLFANADARWGEVHAEILDAESGNVSGYHSTAGPDTLGALPGFVLHRGQTIPLTGDHVRGRLAWKDNPRLAFDKPVRIRFVLRQARLYSFWLELG